MDIEEIQVEIMPDGSLQISVKGVKGSACLDITRDLEQALGGNVITREMSPDAYESSLGLETPQQDSAGIQIRPRRGKKKGAIS